MKTTKKKNLLQKNVAVNFRGRRRRNIYLIKPKHILCPTLGYTIKITHA